MGWVDLTSHARLRSLFTPSPIFRQLPSSRAGIFGAWIFVSLFILLAFLHPLGPVKSGYYGSTFKAATSIEDHSGNSTLGVYIIYLPICVILILDDSLRKSL
jgi:hypothetical protein